MKNKIIILTGKSGCGKNAILENLKKNGYKVAVSYTTRPMRPKEKNHVDYHFIKRATFLNLIKNDGFVEYREYDTVDGKWYYGLGKSEIDLFNNKYVTISDLQGVRALKDYYGAENCIVFYISASKYNRTERAKKRGGFNNEEWERRLKADNYDFRESEVAKYCNFKIDNNGDIGSTLNHIYHDIKIWNKMR